MKKKLLLFLIMVVGQLSAQTGIGTVTPHESAILDLMSADKVLLLPRINDTALITDPQDGMIVYIESSKCYKIYQNGNWSDCIYRKDGTVTGINCAASQNSGILKDDKSAMGVYSVIAYTGGNGTYHHGQSVASTGITGLTATLDATNFVNGNGTLMYTITGKPIGYGTASFAINIGGRTCTLTRSVLQSIGTVTSLDCAGATQSGGLVRNLPASITLELPYTGGNEEKYPAQTITSTGVTGLTATLQAGIFALGNGTVTYTITGTPTTSGTASFAIALGSKNCTLNLTVDNATVATLNCAGATKTGTLVERVAASGVSAAIGYTGGNGGSYSAQTLTSTGVTGLTARLTAGNFATGNGSLTYTVTGTPTSSGTANFAISIGGKSCTLSFTVAATTVATLNCTSGTQAGTLVERLAASGASKTISYTGGNGGGYIAQTITSTGVTGLTASLAAGNLATGNGTLTYTIAGTPSTGGTANFAITIGGKSCTLSATVAPTTVATLNCAGATQTGTLRSGTAVTTASFTVSYTGGNRGGYIAQTITSTGVTGLTARLVAGNLASGNGSLTYTLTGTPSAGGSANFAIAIGGQSCTVKVTIDFTIPTNITLEKNFYHLVSSIYDTDYLPYTAPTTTASLTPVNADGSTDPTIDYQGRVTTTGIKFVLPVTTTGSGTLPAFISEPISVAVNRTQDGISRDVVLSWESQTYTANTNRIYVTVRTLSGTLNIKKLDINSGLGNDALGVVIANIIFPYNNAKADGTLRLRGISGVPDRMFNLPDNSSSGNITTHRFIYTPVMGEDNRIWLRHNLGADYTNLQKADFDPGQDATSVTDYRAYGSMFQWGRKPDGHELVNWTDCCNSTARYGTISGKSDIPTHANFITVTWTSVTDWRASTNYNLWSGLDAVNNPCPDGFRVPNRNNFENYVSVTSRNAMATNLKFVLNGLRRGYETNAPFYRRGVQTNLWTSLSRIDNAYDYANALFFDEDSWEVNAFEKVNGAGVRCIFN